MRNLLVLACVVISGCCILKSGYHTVQSFDPYQPPVIDLRDCKPVSPAEILRRLDDKPKRLPEVVEEVTDKVA